MPSEAKPAETLLGPSAPVTASEVEKAMAAAPIEVLEKALAELSDVITSVHVRGRK